VLVYVIIGGIGLTFLLVTLFAGDVLGGEQEAATLADLSAGHGASTGAPSFFSTRVIAVFMTTFGIGGVLARHFGYSHPVAAVAGVGSGVVLAAAAHQLARLLRSRKGSSGVQKPGLIGRTGQVTVGIPAGGVGQVTLTFGGQLTTRIACAADTRAIPHGTAVLITALRGDTLVVTPEGAAASGGMD
jgi:membrane protein implicated in regulation of membrane protease activity